jgi:serine/threonine protein kinase
MPTATRRPLTASPATAVHTASGAGSSGGSGEYELGRAIGQGAYATARLAMNRTTGERVAVKVYEKYRLLEAQKRKAVRREIAILDQIKHEHIVRFIEAIDSPRHVYIVTEYIGGGSLHALLKKQVNRKLDENFARHIFAQVCEAIKYLHSNNIIHRDIKIDNILLEGENELPHTPIRVKLIDFGFSTIVTPNEHKKIRVFCGTPSYMAPEIVLKSDFTSPDLIGLSGFAADVWAAGVVLYALLCGTFPFKGLNDRELYRRIIKGVFTTPDHISSTARLLLQKLIEVDIKKRTSIVSALQDSWITQSASSSSTHSSSTASSSSDLNLPARPRSAGPALTVTRLPVQGVPAAPTLGPPAMQLTPAMETEAVAKLEKLGYKKDEILTQLKDENSHLYKLYFRFLKAVNSWTTPSK